MMEIHSLSNISVAHLAQAFNAAFEGYFLPIQFSEQQLLDKIKSENIRMDCSVGVTIDGKLAAFMLIGIDTNDNQILSYNAGTGVIPEFRGLHLTKKMYAYLLPLLKEKNIHKHQLEVITQNTKALHIYEQIGYRVTRTVSCFKGTIIDPKINQSFYLKPFDLEDASVVKSFWNHLPTYQNTMSSINRNKELHETLGIFELQELIGYIIYVKNSGRIKQFGVHPNHRRKGIGHQLCYEVQKANPNTSLSIINVDNDDIGTISFLKNIGLTVIIEQFEMIM